jgi:choline dehydrogenase-like flavoprotein
VDALGPNGSVQLEAEEVFLACGALQTPALLRRSGLAPLAGRSLALHPTVKAVAEFAGEVNALGSGVAAQQVKPAGAGFSFGCSISSPAGLALALLDHPEPTARLAKDWRRMAVYYATLPGDGDGEVRVLPGFRAPLVRYRVSAQTLSALGSVLHELARILFAAGARAVYPSVEGADPWESASELCHPEALRAAAARLMTIHLMGSCPMGEDRSRCVADSFGRVHGCQGLHLSDASLLCGPLGVNPQGSIMAVARRNVLRSLGRL